MALVVAIAIAFVLPALSFVLPISSPGNQGDSGSIYPVLLAEDARAPDAASLQVIIDATRNPDPRVRLIGVRALGRLERPALLERAAPLLQDGDAGVRREAANALGQLFFDARGSDVRRPATLLTERLSAEPAPAVRGVILQTLGRLEYSTEDDARAAEKTLARNVAPYSQLRDPSGLSGTVSRRSIDEVDGAIRGLSRLFARRPKVERAPAPHTVAALQEAARRTFPTVGAAMESERYARVRRLAVQTLGISSTLQEDLAGTLFSDGDWQVRRLIVLHGAALAGGRTRSLAALKDPAPQVRFEALRALGQMGTISCPAVLPLTRDRDPHVARRAVATLAQPCEDGALQTLAQLVRVASDGSRASTAAWHLTSAALTSLAAACTRSDETNAKTQACQRAPEIVRGHARDRQWQVRMYSAAPASAFRDRETLQRLARDPHPNVREAAIERLGAATQPQDTPPSVDETVLDALQADDYQLVMTAARALKQSRSANAGSALRAAFDRLVAKRSDTARDTLAALRDALEAQGVKVAPPPSSPKVPPFTRAELDDLLTRERRAIITMKSGGTIELVLLADEAPASVARFVRLARQGAYNELTFHRVEPNFVIQGGSPGANEYAGHDPYMRDEVGRLSHDRGTVGISTRGRDTGDAQIFVNLVDNPRLDHRYTVFARVVRGMHVIDAVVEGDAMNRIEVR